MARILITGAGRGIGKALVAELIKRGHSVTGTVRSQSQADALAAEFGDGLSVLQCDVTQEAEIKTAAKSFDGPLDVLVNNAGVIGPDRQATLDMDFDGFAKTLAINTLAPLMIAQAFLPNLKRGEKPRILTVSSQMGMMNNHKSDRIAYRASKAAVNKVMQGLATDLRPEGIAVQLLHPGWVRSDMGGSSADISVDESASGIADRIEALTIDKTGTFLNYDGMPMHW